MKKIYALLLCVLLIPINGFGQVSYWTPQTSGTSNILYGVYFTSPDVGCAVGNSGVVLKTTDGGTTWMTSTSGTVRNLYAVCFVSANTGFAVGDAGTIIKTTDGGTTWTTLVSGTTHALTSLFFVDANTGYSVGDGGVILQTINGGSTWITQTSGTSNILKSVYFTSANTGYVTGLGGVMLTTANGGGSWSMLGSGTTKALHSVCFNGSGYTVGVDGVILKSGDGLLWSAQPNSIVRTLKTVRFTDTTTGYTLGLNGTILKTTDAGASWLAQTSGVSNYLHSLFFVNSTTGYAVGSNGKILKTISGGDAPLLSVLPSILNLASAANSGSSFTITSNTHWTIINDASWLSLSATSGDGSGSVLVSPTEANTSGPARSATLTVKASGVADQTITVTQYALGTDVATEKIAPINLYPNPVKEILCFSGCEVGSRIMIYNICGTLLLDKTLVNDQLNVSSLSKGVYSVKIMDLKGVFVRKMVKE